MSKKPVKIVTIGGGSSYTPESRKFGLSILKMGKKN